MLLQPATVLTWHLLLGPQTGVPQVGEEVVPPHSEVVRAAPQMKAVLQPDWWQALPLLLSLALVHPLLPQDSSCVLANALLSSAAN